MLSKKSLIWLIPSEGAKSGSINRRAKPRPSNRPAVRRLRNSHTSSFDRWAQHSLVELERSQDGRLPKFFGILPCYGR
jgi:hypothetical protein